MKRTENEYIRTKEFIDRKVTLTQAISELIGITALVAIFSIAVFI